MGIFTCAGCTDRKVGCHATCEKYNREKAEHARIKAKIARERIHGNYINARVNEFKDVAAKNPKYHNGKQ